MNIIHGVFLIATGVGLMGFGLLLFYMVLPLFYFFFGFGVGYELSALLGASGAATNLIVALGTGVAFGLAAYYLEPFRRILIGVGLGSLFGGLIADAAGLTGFIGAALMFVTAMMGVFVTLRIFDIFVIVSTAIGGAGMAMEGLSFIAPSFPLFDKSAIQQGAALPLAAWLVLALVGLGWQFKNLSRWSPNTSGQGASKKDE